MARPQGIKEVGPRDRIPSYYRDTGCQYIGLCANCPFRRCIEDLTIKEHNQFKKDWQLNKALDWRTQ